MAKFKHIKQDVEADANNSSTTNLAVGNSYTFTGTATSTLGVAGIQVSLKTDQDCNIWVEQSPDGTNWDISDRFTYLASDNNFGTTVQAINSYIRVIVIAFTTTTYFRLQTALFPIVEPLPRSLTGQGRLKVSTSKDDYGWEAENTPMGEARMVEPYRCVGTSFSGTTIDSRFWTTAASGTGSIAQANAELVLTSGANVASVTAFTVRSARYVGGSSMRYRSVIQIDAGTANNIRNWGIAYGASMPTKTDGAWFQMSTTTFSVVYMKGSSATTVSSGAFNGELGKTYDPGTSVKTYEIYWTNSKIYFVIGDKVLHSVSASSTTWSSTMNFHAFADSTNAGVATSTTLSIRTATIYRLGRAETQPIYYHLSGNAATHTLKLGAGILHKIMFNNTSGTDITIVDNVTGTTPVVGVITTTTAALGEWDYSLPFNTGLILITTGNGLDATIVYE